MEPKEVTAVEHDEFYRFISNAYDTPRFVLHYKTDAPINVRALIYVPEGKPGLFEMSRESDTGLALYCRRVLIKNKVENLLPKWLRFCKGVVDSEDIPLNLSRELLQESSLIRYHYHMIILDLRTFSQSLSLFTLHRIFWRIFYRKLNRAFHYHYCYNYYYYCY